MAETSDVVILLGGKSPERQISLESGNAVARALTDAGHQVRLLDPKYQIINAFDWQENSVAVVMLHGTYGEDGQVQAELDALKIPYTGSNQQASQSAFQKHVAKQIFFTHQLPTPDWKCLNSSETHAKIHAEANELGYPVVVKPDAQGSSIGVSIVSNELELIDAFQLACEFDNLIIIEKAIIGNEWTIPVLDGQALPAIRIAAKRTFFDYTAKYQDDETEYEVIHQNDSLLARQATEVSLQACETLRTQGISRVDLIVDDDNQPWILEVNTIPGMTNHSLVPKAARSIGWSMSELCERILFSALPNRSS